MPVVLIPVHFDRDPAARIPSCSRSIVLRPFLSSDFMTGVPILPGSERLPLNVSIFPLILINMIPAEFCQRFWIKWFVIYQRLMEYRGFSTILQQNHRGPPNGSNFQSMFAFLFFILFKQGKLHRLNFVYSSTKPIAPTTHNLFTTMSTELNLTKIRFSDEEYEHLCACKFVFFFI